MHINKKDLKIERIRGSKKAGGGHRNCTASCVRVTHIPTGISVTIDQRNQHKNLAVAMRELERRLKEARLAEKAVAKKKARDDKIKNGEVIRTYDYKRKVVKDHRTGKTASLKEIIEDGNLDLLQ